MKTITKESLINFNGSILVVAAKELGLDKKLYMTNIIQDNGKVNVYFLVTNYGQSYFESQDLKEALFHYNMLKVDRLKASLEEIKNVQEERKEYFIPDHMRIY